jgi:putative RecB family exonuclease
MRDRPSYRSYSQLDQWLTCGEQYRLQRRVGVKEKPSVWLPGGTAFHNTAERYDRNEMGDASVEEVFTEEWMKACNAQIERLDPEDQDITTWRAANKGTEGVQFWLDNGPKWVHGYITWRETNTNTLSMVTDGDRLLIEAEMMPILNGVAVKMFPDRIMVDQYGQLLVVDLKTGKSDIPSSLQLGVYKVGVEKLLGLPVDYGAYYKARKRDLDPPLRLDQWTEEVIGNLFAAFDRQERAEEYLPNIGSHCKYMCGMKAHCVYVGGTKHPDDH